MLKSVPLSKVYRLIEPGPVVLVTTAYKGQANIMTMTYHMMLCHQPPVIGIDLGPWNHSFKALRATKECVIAIPTVDLASKAVEIGNCSGEDIDKFEVIRPDAGASQESDAAAHRRVSCQYRMSSLGRQLGSQVQPLHPRTREGLD